MTKSPVLQAIIAGFILYALENALDKAPENTVVHREMAVRAGLVRVVRVVGRRGYGDWKPRELDGGCFRTFSAAVVLLLWSSKPAW